MERPYSIFPLLALIQANILTFVHKCHFNTKNMTLFRILNYFLYHFHAVSIANISIYNGKFQLFYLKVEK
jgi:hypothetical protein